MKLFLQGVDFEPGDNLSYSNSGYYLLSRLLERNFPNLIGIFYTQNIVNPLSLHHTEAEIVKKQKHRKAIRLKHIRQMARD